MSEQEESEYYIQLSTQWTKELLTIKGEFEQVAKLFELVEAQVSLLEKTVYKVKVASIACEKGCAHCCYLPVKTLPSIARYIAEKFLRDENKHLTAQLKTQLLAYIKNTQTDRQACPFLDNNQCSIYAFRPLACRTFTSFEVKLCEQNLLVQTQIPQQAFRYQLYQAATAALQIVAMKSDQAYLQVDFIPAVFKAL